MRHVVWSSAARHHRRRVRQRTPGVRASLGATGTATPRTSSIETLLAHTAMLIGFVLKSSYTFWRSRFTSACQWRAGQKNTAIPLLASYVDCRHLEPQQLGSYRTSVASRYHGGRASGDRGCNAPSRAGARAHFGTRGRAVPEDGIESLAVAVGRPSRGTLTAETNGKEAGILDSGFQRI